jgi:hypothetical protein
MMLDSGMPLGPGLLATWVPVPGPNTKNAKARINAAAIATNVSDPILRPRSLFGMWLSFVSDEGGRWATGVVTNASRQSHDAHEMTRAKCLDSAVWISAVQHGDQAKLAGITNSVSQDLMIQ